MRGFPKHIATKEDLDVCLQEFPDQTKEWMGKKEEERQQWFPAETLDKSEGVTDETHKVVEQVADLKAPAQKIQMVLLEDPANPLVRLGISREDVAKVMAVSVDEKPIEEPLAEERP